MTAAYYLALKGYGVTVFEALPVAGGMMMLGIPRYRLPREVIDREVAMLEELGVEFRVQHPLRGGRQPGEPPNRRASRPCSSPSAPTRPSSSTSPGKTTIPQVIEAIDFLRRVALGDRRAPGRARGRRRRRQRGHRRGAHLPAAGCEEVTIAYRRTRAEMPADIEEVEQAEDEGIHFSFLTDPHGDPGNGRPAHGAQLPPGRAREKGRQRPPVPRARRRQRLHHRNRLRHLRHRPAGGSGLPRGSERPQVDPAPDHPGQHGQHGDLHARCFCRRGCGHRSGHGGGGHRRRRNAPPRPSIGIFPESPSPRCRRCRCAGRGWTGWRSPPAPR